MIYSIVFFIYVNEPLEHAEKLLRKKKTKNKLKHENSNTKANWLRMLQSLFFILKNPKTWFGGVSKVHRLYLNRDSGQWTIQVWTNTIEEYHIIKM